MKKSATILILLGLFLISPAVLAQEQVPIQEKAEIYSGFNRFADNVKMFFSFRDKKVMLALDIRDKELNSAIINTKNKDDKEAEKNLERAKKKLQFVQNKVSRDMAENVKNNVNKTINKVKESGNLSYNLETYLLEEEKTKLTAELAIKTEGKNKVEITIDGDGGQARVMEINGKIMEINNQIAERAVDDVIKESGHDGSPIPKEDGVMDVVDDGVIDVVENNVIDDGVMDVVKNNVINDRVMDIKDDVKDGVMDVKDDVKDGVKDVVKDDVVKDDEIQVDNKGNEDVSTTVNEIDNEVDDGPGEPGVIDKD